MMTINLDPSWCTEARRAVWCTNLPVHGSRAVPSLLNLPPAFDLAFLALVPAPAPSARDRAETRMSTQEAYLTDLATKMVAYVPKVIKYLISRTCRCAVIKLREVDVGACDLHVKYMQRCLEAAFRNRLRRLNTYSKYRGVFTSLTRAHV